ncbi:alkaline phosphatase family protein [Allosaccharopolyspora coralli]|uniref:Alkaline phosphatase family protein n=1 Tax=Allosaccharopolyspora coralli TaxID=2665642 RepID=A0A5Q3Q7U9_9PSEU|nr:alkaline phosphatase D family protein [Allosaccharopolyspora coralli]QGK70562.1 alkaline phosphatase family protein [Allosaccharopolyspora coralli]
MTTLVLGPVLRYVDDTSATVWVETDRDCLVEILGSTAHTFHAGGHHFALVRIRGLEPGTTRPYEVRLDGEKVWPLPHDPRPPCQISTVPTGPESSLRLLFGSCRFGASEDPKQDAALGPDALADFVDELTSGSHTRWPDAMLLLGDQVYADETTPQVRRDLARKRDLNEPPGHEVADFEEYTLLYRHAWREPYLRWLLSTVPSMMIFDDHDVRDDWNTSGAWRAQMAREPWWRERLLGGLASYWIYQHIGNLDPDTLDRDETFQHVLEQGRDGDALPILRELAAAADDEHDAMHDVRWSYRRDLGPARLLVLDTRGGRVLDTGRRSMLSDVDFDWAEQELQTTPEHVVVGSSLPWLLPTGIHHLQEWDEAIAARGGRLGRLGEKIRQELDLEHWAAFRGSFDRFTDLLRRTARRTDPPATITVLSGDVHHSYLADPDCGGARCRVTQVVSSPLHNETPLAFTPALRLAWTDPIIAVLRRVARWAGVRALPVHWRKSAGPYFGNAVGLLDLDRESASVALRVVDHSTGRLTRGTRRRLSSTRTPTS